MINLDQTEMSVNKYISETIQQACVLKVELEWFVTLILSMIICLTMKLLEEVFNVTLLIN